MKLKLILFALVFAVFNQCYGQKVKFNNDIATIDGTDYIVYRSELFSSEISISGLSSNNEDIFGVYREYHDPRRVSNANEDGSVHWIELYFPSLDLRCEVPTSFRKGLVKLIYRNKLFTGGELNEANARRFVKKYGRRYSKNRPRYRRNQNVNIIINN